MKKKRTFVGQEMYRTMQESHKLMKTSQEYIDLIRAHSRELHDHKAHACFDINTDLVWDAIRNDRPALRDAID